MTKIDLDNVEWTILGDKDFVWVEPGPKLDAEGNPIPPTNRPDNEGEAMPEGPGFRPTGDWVEPGDGEFDEPSYGGYRYTGDAKFVQIPDEINGKPLTSYNHLFRGNQSVIAVKSNNNIVTSAVGTFRLFNNDIDYLDLSKLDVSNVTTMNDMFNESNVSEINITGWDTSNVELFQNFLYSFRSNRKHIPLDISLIDTSGATNIARMFYAVEDSIIDLSSFDTSNIGSMDGAFQRVRADKIILNSFDISNVYSLNTMFMQTEVPILDLSSFDLSGNENVNKRRMFEDSKIDTIYVRSELEKSIFEEAETELPRRTEIIVGGEGYVPPVSGQPIETIIEEEEAIKFKVRKTKDRKMRDGEEKLVQEGKDGKRINRVKVLTYPDGTEERKVISSRVIKPVKHKIIKVGTLLSEETEREDKVIPHETKQYKDYDAREGEHIEQRGEDGYSNKTYTVIKHSDGYVERILEEEDYKEPVTEIIAIGMIERTNRVTKDEVIPHRTFKEYSYDHKQNDDGEPDVIERGKDGVIKRTYEVTTYTDDTPQKWDLISELTTRTEPEDEKLRYGLIESKKEVKEENVIKFEVQQRYSKDLLEGEERLIQDGKDGLDIRYYEVVSYVRHPETNSLRSPLKEELTSKREYTAPTPHIIEIGSKEPIESIEDYVDEEVVKHQTVYIDTDELYEGQEEVVKEGKDGKKIIRYQEITYIDGTTKRHDIGIETVPATDKVVRRGTKDPVISEDTETVEEVIPYETAVIKTNDLEPGIREVKREGVDGKAVRTYKVMKMWDGKVERELISEDRTEAVFAIILLGTSKKITSQMEIPEVTEIPYEVEKVQTDKLYIGQTKVKRPGKNGAVRNIYVKTVFEDGTVERVLIKRRTTAAINEIVLVGTRVRQAEDSIENIRPMNDKMSGNWLYLEDGDHTIRATVKTKFRPKWGYL